MCSAKSCLLPVPAWRRRLSQDGTFKVETIASASNRQGEEEATGAHISSSESRPVWETFVFNSKHSVFRKISWPQDSQYEMVWVRSLGNFLDRWKQTFKRGKKREHFIYTHVVSFSKSPNFILVLIFLILFPICECFTTQQLCLTKKWSKR